MTTLTLDKSRNALAVLAWRKGLTRKPFATLRTMHRDAQETIVRSTRPRALTAKQAKGVNRRR